MTSALVSPQESRDALRQQIQQSVRDAVRDVRDAAREASQSGAPVPAEAQGLQAQKATIDALRAEITAEKAVQTRLTEQLTPGQSDARVRAINQQLADSRDRVESLQGQLDRALGLPTSNVTVTVPPFPGEQIPPQVVPLVSVIFGSLVVMVVGWPIARAWARRMDRRYTAPPPAADTGPRFDRIEQAIEAVAIEVERISEGQRFTTRLMNEMRSLPAPNPLNDLHGAQQRVAEPVERGSERRS